MRTAQIAIATSLLVGALGTSKAVAQSAQAVAVNAEGITAFEWEADPGAVPAVIPSWLLKTPLVTGVSTGAQDAPITILVVDHGPTVEIPAYSRFYRESLPKIYAKYVKTGLVKLVALNEESGGSYGLALVCADDQNLGWEFNMTSYSQFAPQFGTFARVEGDSDKRLLTAIAETAGLNSKAFAECFSSKRGSIEEMRDGSGRVSSTRNPLFRTDAQALFQTPAYGWRATISVGMSDERAFSGVALDLAPNSERAVLDWLEAEVSGIRAKGRF